MLNKIALALVPLSLVGVVTMASCAGTLENPDQFSGSAGPGSGGGASTGGCNIAGFDMEAILTDTSEPAGCAKTSCHNADSPFGDFVAPGLVERLQTNAKLGSCTSEQLVTPGDPQASVLYTRLAGSDCGQQMPFGIPDEFWTADELACAAEWINGLQGSGPGPGAGGSGAGGEGSGGEGSGGEATGGAGGDG